VISIKRRPCNENTSDVIVKIQLIYKQVTYQLIHSVEAIFFQGDGKNFHGVKSSESVLKLRMCATAHESAQKQEQKEVKLRKRNQKWANACQNKTKAHKSV
jgi:hypothetical protein